MGCEGKKTGCREGEKSVGNEGKNILGKVKNSQKGRETPMSVKEQGTFWKLDKEFRERVRVKR